MARQPQPLQQQLQQHSIKPLASALHRPAAQRHARRPRVLAVAAADKQPEQQPTSSGAPTAAAASEAQAALAAIASTSTGSGSAVEQGVADLARSMLMSDKDTAQQLERYEEALQRLEANKAAAAELERRFEEAGRDIAISEAQKNAETRTQANQIMAQAEVAAAEKMLLAAEAEMSAAMDGKSKASQDAERKETVKAGLAAAAAGLVFSLPLLLSTQSGGLVGALLGLGATVGSCFLFGVTYRYVVRYDVTNTHLRGGAVGAFGLVRAGAAADVLQATSSKGPFDLTTVMGPAALYAGESMLVFLFASAAVEKAFDAGLVRRFGDDPLAKQQAQEKSAASP